ncbi:hypothetical protein EGW08_012735 [Elysia chlorotica]|uniref:G-protein coupled receptors family 1 profile domain-containing protein n=1 Tax=Elysia chlorotica TaxID=188477 RepID=A0A433TD93_ELYCH|nr:hypothetical protein EGW08_012735 [Elysia chlorotica]
MLQEDKEGQERYRVTRTYSRTVVACLTVTRDPGMEHHEWPPLVPVIQHQPQHGHHDQGAATMGNQSGALHHLGRQTYLLGPDARFKFELVFNLVLTFSFSATGVLTNSINIAVFARQGLSETANINFLALSLSDLVIVAWFLAKALCENPLLVHASPLFLTLRDFFLLTLPVYHAAQGFGAWVTALITVERTVCIVYPLRVKTIFTPARVSAALALVLLFELASLAPPYSSMQLVWVVSAGSNLTKLRHADQHGQHGALSYLVFYTAPSLAAFTVVTLGTAILVVKLRQSVRRRQEMTHKSGQEVAQKEVKVAQSVVLVCVMFVVCYSPCVYVIVKGALDPDFHFGDPYYEHFVFSYLSVTFFLQSVSSSMNMFVYIKLSSRYKQTFRQVFCAAKPA